MARKRPSDELLLKRLVHLVRGLPRDRQEQLYDQLTTGNVPVETIAERFGVCWRTVQRALKEGRIEGKRVGLRWAVSQEEFARLEREGFPARTPGKKAVKHD